MTTTPPPPPPNPEPDPHDDDDDDVLTAFEAVYAHIVDVIQTAMELDGIVLDTPSKTPRYRVLVFPRWHHDTVTPYHPDGGPHTLDCAESVLLEVHRTDAAWLRVAGDRALVPIGDVVHHGAADVGTIRDTVCDWLRQRSLPHVSAVLPAHVAVYVELRDGS